MKERKKYTCRITGLVDIVLRITGKFFGVVALIHLLRIIAGVSVIIAGQSIPLGLSIIALKEDFNAFPFQVY